MELARRVLMTVQCRLMDWDVLLVMHTALLLLVHVRLLLDVTLALLDSLLRMACVWRALRTSSFRLTARHVSLATATATLDHAVRLWAALNATTDTRLLFLAVVLHARQAVSSLSMD
jgi:hypothetical protein